MAPETGPTPEAGSPIARPSSFVDPNFWQTGPEDNAGFGVLVLWWITDDVVQAFDLSTKAALIVAPIALVLGILGTVPRGGFAEWGRLLRGVHTEHQGTGSLLLALLPLALGAAIAVSAVLGALGNWSWVFFVVVLAVLLTGAVLRRRRGKRGQVPSSRA